MMGFRLEKNELVRRLIKGVFETKPAFPKYSTTWDVNIVLKELDTWTPVEKLTLKRANCSVVGTKMPNTSSPENRLHLHGALR